MNKMFPSALLRSLSLAIASITAPIAVTAWASQIDEQSFVGSSISTGEPVGVAVADFDGDGKVDIVAANYYRNTVSFYRNIGTGGTLSSNSFAPAVVFPTGPSPYRLSVGDIDGDGKVDVAVANSGGSTISVYHNNYEYGVLNNNSFTKTDINVGVNPTEVEIADLNCDGMPELIVPVCGNWDGNSVVVLRNIGAPGNITTSSFASPVSFKVGYGPYGVAVGDIDGDGIPDLAVANDKSGTISVLRNKTTPGSTLITFASTVDFAVGARPLSVKIGDLDGDGKSDIAVSMYGSGKVSIFKNLSIAGNFTTSSLAPSFDLPTDGSTHVVVLRDLNGDGKPEVLAASEYADSVAIFENRATNGTLVAGSFGSRVDIKTSGNPCGIAIGDLNGDFRPDLVLANNALSTLSVLQNGLSGGFPALITAQPEDALSTVGGTPVFAVTAVGQQPLTFQWYNNKNSSISWATNSDLFLTNAQPSDAGKYYVVVSNPNGSVTSSVANLWFLAPPTITSQPQSLEVNAGDSASFSVLVSGSGQFTYQWQFDGTNLVDATNSTLVVSNVQPVNAGSYSVSISSLAGSVLSSNALLTVLPPRRTIDSQSFGGFSIATGRPVGVGVADFDGDGKDDVVAANFGNGTVSFYRNIGSGGFLGTNSFAPAVVFPAGANAYYLALGDIDGDGKVDVAVANVGESTASVYHNDCVPGVLNSNSFKVFNLQVGSTPAGVAIADLDGDGKPEIVTPIYDHASGNTVAVLRNVGSPGIINSNSFVSPITFTVGTGAHAVAVGDIDGDGMPDLAVANDGSGTVSILRNTTAPGSTPITFAPSVDFAVGARPRSVALGDLNSDGKPDVVVGNYGSGSVSVFKNVSSAGAIATSSLAPAFNLLTGGSTHAVAIKDLNGDGKPELLTVSENGNNLAVFENRGSKGSLVAESFGPRINITTGGNPCAIGIGDLDGDSWPDVVVANNYGNTLSVFQNMLSGAVFIKTQPQDQTATVGATKTLSISAVGQGTLSYGWFFDTNSPRLLGTNSSLTLTNLQLSDAGQYFVIVSNMNGAVTSAVANVKVLMPLTISTPPQTQAVIAGDTGSFSVGVTGSEPISYQWRRNGINLVGATNSTLWITNVQAANAGTYSAYVSNPVGSVLSSGALLSVFSVPQIAVQPTSQTVICGGSVSFSVLATVPSSMTYQWSLDGRNISGATNSTLSLGKVFPSDAGVYTVLLSNPAGVTTSSNAILTVVPVSLSAQPLNQTVYAGQDATFSVSVLGIAPFSYQWQWNGTNITDATNSSLIIRNVQAHQTGVYNVVVGNQFGTVSSSTAVLSIRPAPVTINSFSPIMGAAGTLVTINGANFNPIASSNFVSFGNVVAVVDSASSTQLVVKVPTNAVTSSITVKTGESTSSSAVPFMVVFPSVRKIDPNAFVGPVSLPAARPVGVAVADFDGDGKSDIVVANWDHRAVAFYRNIGTGGLLSSSSFAPAVEFPAGVNAYYLAVGDIDRDGKTDVVVANVGESTLSVYHNECVPGVFNSNSFKALNIQVGSTPAGVVIADLNSDGKPEIITPIYDNANGQTVAVLRNISSPGTITSNSFASPVTFTAGKGVRGVAAGDIDGDGMPDLAVANDGGGSISILRNTTASGSSSITFASNVDFTVGSRPSWVAIGDLDADGKSDVAVSTYGSRKISVYKNISTPGAFTTNSFAPAFDLPTGGSTHVVAIKDLNGDGKPELLAVSEYANALAIFENRGTNGTLVAGSFGPHVDVPSATNPCDIGIGDLNGDGRPDVVIADNYSPYVQVFQNVIGSPAPVISVQPADAVVVAGTDASFSVSASGADLHYQWFISPADAIPDATDSVLNLHSVQVGGAKQYYVIVTNSFGTETSRVASVTVVLAPAITTQPQGQTVVAGGGLSLSVEASGTGPLSYQWFFNGTAITGETNSSFTLADVEPVDAGNYQVTVSSSYGSITSSNALVTVKSALLQVPDLSAAGGSAITVPVSLVALGTENGLSFSLSFDPNVLKFVQIDSGSGIGNAAVYWNTQKAADGQIGVSLAMQPGSTFTPGTQELVRLSFTVAPLTSSTVSSINFSDSPVAIKLGGADNRRLGVTFVNGSVAISKAEYEADVNHDHLIDIFDWIQIGRYVAGLDPVPNSDVFQRADCAPAATAGNGRLTIVDWVQAGIFTKDATLLAPLSGPTGDQVSPAFRIKSALASTAPVVSLIPVAGQTNVFDVRITSGGDENALAFTLSFDPTVLRYVDATSLIHGATLIVNTNVPGKVGIAVALQPGTSLQTGVQSLVRIEFTPVLFVAKNSAVVFCSSPIAMELSDAFANSLPVNWSDASVTVEGQTPPTLTITTSTNAVTVSWSVNATGFVLESSSAFGSGWNPVSATPTTNAAVISVTLPPPTETQFYRLKLP